MLTMVCRLSSKRGDTNCEAKRGLNLSVLIKPHLTANNRVAARLKVLTYKSMLRFCVGPRLVIKCDLRFYQGSQNFLIKLKNNNKSLRPRKNTGEAITISIAMGFILTDFMGVVNSGKGWHRLYILEWLSE